MPWCWQAQQECRTGRAWNSLPRHRSTSRAETSQQGLRSTRRHLFSSAPPQRYSLKTQWSVARTGSSVDSPIFDFVLKQEPFRVGKMAGRWEEQASDLKSLMRISYDDY